MTNSNAPQLTELAGFRLGDELIFETDSHGLTLARIASPLCNAAIALHGAHVLGWQPRGEKEVLFLSAHSDFAPGRPIRGGIPIIVPWFGPRAGDAAAPAHGWARRRLWQVLATRRAAAGIEIELGLNSETDGEEDCSCNLRLRACFGSRLEVELTIKNSSDASLQFEEALHTYLALSDVRQATVRGLECGPYCYKVNERAHDAAGAPLQLQGETDRIYAPTSHAVTVHDPGWNRSLRISKRNSEATVVWNPWRAKAAALADFGDDEWPGMLCIEAANVGAGAIGLPAAAEHSLLTAIEVITTGTAGH
jgi:glucose-6-phosphate 1-epimerase